MHDITGSAVRGPTALAQCVADNTTLLGAANRLG